MASRAGQEPPGASPLLQVRGLVKHYPRRRGWMGRVDGVLRAVDGVDLEVGAGEVVGLVGESGSGKSTLGRCILRLVEPTAGTVRFAGTDLLALRGKALRSMRRQLQIIFQDPFGSLNPRMTAAGIIGEPLGIHRVTSRKERPQRVAELMEMVGLDPDLGRRYPHEFSGGQRQRIGIARAMALSPRLIIADEPVSSLDVSVRAQILNLMLDLQERLGLAYLFIAHDLTVVQHISDRVAVMYAGKIVEQGAARDVYENPLHPYTRALLASVPVPEPGRQRPPLAIQGEPASRYAEATGCSFRGRCPLAVERCATEEPPLRDFDHGHAAACHLVEGTTGSGAHLPPAAPGA